MSKNEPLNHEQTEMRAVEKILSKKHLSYVLITCSAPSLEGDMNVEMACKGDPDLLSMMMEGAKQRLV